MSVALQGTYAGSRGGRRFVDAYLATPRVTVSRLEPTFDGEESDVTIMLHQGDEYLRLVIDPTNCQDLVAQLAFALAQDPPVEPPPRRRGRRRQKVNAPPTSAPTPEPRRARLERLMARE